LVLIDEIDSRSDEPWPYEMLFSYLDRNLVQPHQLVFALAGSMTGGMQSMIHSIEKRPKGLDLLSRIPQNLRFAIPPLDIEDRAVVFASSVGRAAAEKGVRISEVEKFAIYFLLMSNELSSARELRSIAYAAVNRIGGTSRLHFDDLFENGDHGKHDFWSEHKDVAKRLADQWILV
jgi:hypothetical protein